MREEDEEVPRPYKSLTPREPCPRRQRPL